jgi:hypothetical protein
MNRPAALALAVSAIAVCTGLGGCAGVAPGEAAPTFKQSPLARVPQFQAGEVADGGVYQPSAQEKALDCKKLTGSMRIIASRLRDSPNRPQPTGAAAFAQQTAASLTGKPGIDIPAEERRERARFEAYNRLLAEKKCPTLNLDAELARKS